MLHAGTGPWVGTECNVVTKRTAAVRSATLTERVVTRCGVKRRCADAAQKCVLKCKCLTYTCHILLRAETKLHDSLPWHKTYLRVCSLNVHLTTSSATQFKTRQISGQAIMNSNRYGRKRSWPEVRYDPGTGLNNGEHCPERCVTRPRLELLVPRFQQGQ